LGAIKFGYTKRDPVVLEFFDSGMKSCSISSRRDAGADLSPLPRALIKQPSETVWNLYVMFTSCPELAQFLEPLRSLVMPTSLMHENRQFQIQLRR
tara:strand:- start:22 stop:309 length:288 start_codon:yes stop_codon:yes gene_type:complete